MARPAALVFGDPGQIASWVRRLAPDGHGERTVHEVARRDGGAGNTLLVMATAADRAIPLGRPLLTVRLDGNEVTLEGLDEPLRVVRTRTVSAPMDLVAASPWRQEPTTPGQCLFVTDDHGLAARLAADSLRLGNDRLATARAEDGRWLVRIDEPPFYLVQWSLEQRVALYREATPGVWVRWGWEHPLCDLLQDARRGQRVVFVEPEHRWETGTIPWADIYEGAGFQLDAVEAVPLRPPTDGALSLQVTLELAPRGQVATAELWVVDGIDRVEALVGGLDEDDVRELLIYGGATSDGGTRWFLRTRTLARGAAILSDLAGGFARYLGFHNLYLPVGLELVPRLRRDRYRALFELEPGVLTVLEQPGDGRPQLVRLSERDFVPASTLTDYVMASASERLEALVAASTFDLGPYKSAMSRPDLVARARTPTRTAEAAAAAVATQTPPPVVASASPERTAPLRPSTPPRTPALPATPVGLEAEMDRLERALIRDGQSLARWERLHGLQVAMGRLDCARDSAIAALWLATDADAKRLLKTMRPSLGGDDPAGAVLATVLGSEPPATGERDGWLHQASMALRAVEPDLDPKRRWLLWRGIFELNDDERERARVRAGILDGLDHGGLEASAVPGFIQRRLMNEQRLEPDDDPGGAHGETGEAHATLDLLADAMQRIAPRGLRGPVRAVLARAYGRLGDHDALTHLAQAAQRGETLDARVPLYLADAWSGVDDGESERQRDRYLAARRGAARRLAEHLDELDARLVQRREEGASGALIFRHPGLILFPEGAHHRDPVLDSWVGQVEEALRQGLLDRVPERVEMALTAAGEALQNADDLREVARAVNTLGELVAKLQSGASGAEILSHFRAFAERVSYDTVAASSDPFYAALLCLGIAHGLMAQGDHAAALSDVADAVGGYDRQGTHPALDRIDVCGRAAVIIEEAPIAFRTQPLRDLLEVARWGRGPTNWGGTEDAWLRLMDQLAEASMSKTRLAVLRYKRYRDADELIIRQRLWEET